jgi:hypothetical protein
MVLGVAEGRSGSAYSIAIASPSAMRASSAAVALIMGIVIIIIDYRLFFGGFSYGSLLTLSSLTFMAFGILGLCLLIGGAASLTSGLGPP